MIKNLLGETDPYCDELIKRFYSPVQSNDTMIFNFTALEETFGEKSNLFTLTQSIARSNKRKVCFIINNRIMTLNEVIDQFRGNNEYSYEEYVLRAGWIAAEANADQWLQMSMKEHLAEIKKIKKLGLENYNGNLLELLVLDYPELCR